MLSLVTAYAILAVMFYIISLLIDPSEAGEAALTGVLWPFVAISLLGLTLYILVVKTRERRGTP